MLDARHYRDKAAQCRRLAKDVMDAQASEKLEELAREYDGEAERLSNDPDDTGSRQ